MTYSQQHLELTYSPEMAMILYKSQDNHTGTYVETRKIHRINGSLVYGAGKPITPRSAQKIRELLEFKATKEQQTPRRCGLLPTNVLSVSNHSLIWFSKPQTRELRIKDIDTTLKVKCPGLVFTYGFKGGLSVHAVKTKRRPTATTKLYHAPLWNVVQKDNGTICMGSTRIEAQSTIENQTKACEVAFFGSYFSHVTEKDELLKLWQELARTNKDFPLGTLVRSKSYPNLEKLINAYDK